MKHYIIILALMLGVFANAQSKKDLARHAGAPEITKSFMKKAEITDYKKGFALYKLYGLEEVLQTTTEEKQTLLSFFESQYDGLQVAYNKFKASGSDSDKLNLIKLIVDNEESFRKSLPADKLTAYVSYGKKGIQSIPYADNYLSDYELEKYKKNL